MNIIDLNEEVDRRKILEKGNIASKREKGAARPKGRNSNMIRLFRGKSTLLQHLIGSFTAVFIH